MSGHGSPFSPKREGTVHYILEKFHEDLKKWQRSNEKSSRRIFWASVAMIILVAAQIILTVCF